MTNTTRDAARAALTESYDRGLRDGMLAAKDTLRVALALRKPSTAMDVFDKIIREANERLDEAG